MREDAADGALDSVRLCVSAAEALPPHTFDRWQERFGLEIVDGIGSTEMLHIFCSNRPGAVRRGTTGEAVPGYELRITDEDGRILEGPAVGNLEVRGDSCAAFYWHQHEKTKACMRGDWFTTGDRYERREDGAYVFVGRTDEMLKVGGLWVSPIDMEHVIVDHPEVQAAGVVGVMLDDASRIAAFVERRGSETRPTSWPRSCARCARSACAATSTRTSCASSTSCRARPAARCSASSCARWRRRRRSADWLCRVRTLRHGGAR